MRVNIAGGGLAGVEAAWALANRGVAVRIFEMKPNSFSDVHKSDKLAEIVCSNSFGNMSLTTASGVLKKEMEILDSLIVRIAYKAKVDAGGALAVDRELFSALITKEISSHKNIEIVRDRVLSLDDKDIWIVACGPLCDKGLVAYLEKIVGSGFLYFFDAIAPIVYAESVDFSKGFWGSRYSEDKDYFNCVLSEDEYDEFYNALIDGEKVEFKEFEKNYFEACLPVEEIAKRGRKTLTFGPLKPVGLEYNGKQPFAVLQLRKENKDGSLLGLVGFQTKLTYPEQKRIFGMIPALKNAEFAKLGSLHRNTFINSPKILNNFLQMNKYKNIFFAGQITGVEGYMASAASGIFAGMNAALYINGKDMIQLPKNSMLGGLIDYITTKDDNFQPLSENFGFIETEKIRNKKERRKKQAKIAINNIRKWRQEYESYFS
jgi:methylenetetrahydrofolate--tRNA-(uracil-5-)-methyltransferase